MSWLSVERNLYVPHAQQQACDKSRRGEREACYETEPDTTRTESGV